jgi:multiple sugar transport system substrate-binding protein
MDTKLRMPGLFSRGLTRRRFLGTTAALGAASVFAGRGYAAPDLKGVELNLMVIQPHVVGGRVIAEEFGKATGAKVNVIAVPNDQILEKATLDVQSGANVYDVIDYWYGLLGTLADDGTVIDVTDRLEADFDTADFLGALYDPYTLSEGRRWGVPYDGDTHVLFYNTEIFAKHGQKPPKTWDEYLATAKAITEAEKGNGVYGVAMLGQKEPFQIGCSYANRLAGFGGDFLDADGKPLLDSEISIMAAQAMLDVTPYCLPTPLETGFEQGLPAFLSGRAAMMEFWTDLGVNAEDPGMSQIVGKWDAVQIPVGGSNTEHRASLDAGFGLAISAGSKQPDAAWELIKFACSKEMNLKAMLTPASGIDPVYRSVLDGEAYKAGAPKVQAAAAQALNGALAWPTGIHASKMLQDLTDELALILEGSKTPEQAMKDAQASWVATLG